MTTPHEPGPGAGGPEVPATSGDPVDNLPTIEDVAYALGDNRTVAHVLGLGLDLVVSSRRYDSDPHRGGQQPDFDPAAEVDGAHTSDANDVTASELLERFAERIRVGDTTDVLAADDADSLVALITEAFGDNRTAYEVREGFSRFWPGEPPFFAYEHVRGGGEGPTDDMEHTVGDANEVTAALVTQGLGQPFLTRIAEMLATQRTGNPRQLSDDGTELAPETASALRSHGLTEGGDPPEIFYDGIAAEQQAPETPEQ